MSFKWLHPQHIFNMKIISIRKHVIDTTLLMTLPVPADVLSYLWSYDIYDTLSTE